MPNDDNIIITPEILKLIADIDEFKGCWKVIEETLAPEELANLRRIATIERAGSSARMVVANRSDAEVEKLLSGLENEPFAGHDEQGVAAYVDVLDMIFDGFKAIGTAENQIRQLHGMLLGYSAEDQEHRGQYKKVPTYIEAIGPDGKGNGVLFETATPSETPGLMEDLVNWFNRSVEQEMQHSLIRIGIFIVVFLTIQPFRDGNGRLSRLLSTLLLLRAGYSYAPYSSMESVIERNRSSFYIALRHTQQTFRAEEQNWEPWLVFFLKTMAEQKNNLAMKIKGIRALRATLPALSRQILELVKTRGEITVKEIKDSTGANRNTIKVHLKKLAEQHYLALVGKGRGARYL